MATVAVAIVAFIHVTISIVEVFFWQVPAIYSRLDFTAEVARQVAPIVQNAGLYNSFIAAGLLWSVFNREYAQPLRSFFLVCVIAAGVFGAVTLRPTTLVLQTIPAVLALILVWVKRNPELKAD